MARALLLALTCAAAASAARYVDYSGVKMPAYGSVAAADYEARDAAPASDDYRGQSPDAPASPDYKYEEEPRIKTEKPMKDSDDTEGWRKPGRKQRGLVRPMDSATADIVHKFERDEEEVPKMRPSHRYAKHRTRLKSESPARDEESLSRRQIKYSRDRKDDVSDIDRKDYFHVDKDDFPDDKSKEFDEDVKFLNEATTRRRRKPRDRQLKRKTSDLEASYDDEDLDRRLKGDVDKEPARRTRPPESRAADRFRTLVEDEDDDITISQPASKLKPKMYDEYDDYYDMKRVNSIKSKLPSLLRRTTERARRPTPTSFLDSLWTNRRKMPPARRRFNEDNDDDDQEDNAPATSSTSTSTPSSTTPDTTTTTSTTTTTTPTTTIPTTTTSVITTTSSTTTVDHTVLSLAEKSRLSIMKKDQRKEGLHIEPPTKKPPVLLQVTRYVPTVVMVEPPSSIIPWMRATEVSDDSPERLNRVKKLMRHKLVASSKNIHELTNNWDEQVCDYVDTSLLDNGACALQFERTDRAACALLALACTLLNSCSILYV